jgi:hypothetical protein
MATMTPHGGLTGGLPLPHAVTVFVGNFGSGKTEIAINYAMLLASTGQRVQLVDIDLVNAYFRSREARAYVQAHGVEVVAPEGEYAFADLPIMLAEVGGSLRSHPGRVVFDVGGDDLGARVLGGFAALLVEAQAAVLQVVNARRPFTDSLAGCRQMYDELEAAARVRIGGLVANAHLIGETTPEVVRQGVALAREMEQATGVPLVFAAVERGVLQQCGQADLGCPVLAIDRYMTSPWERSQRRDPIGRPPRTHLPLGE